MTGLTGYPVHRVVLEGKSLGADALRLQGRGVWRPLVEFVARFRVSCGIVRGDRRLQIGLGVRGIFESVVPPSNLFGGVGSIWTITPKRVWGWHTNVTIAGRSLDFLESRLPSSQPENAQKGTGIHIGHRGYENSHAERSRGIYSDFA
jgi:hypothetical protein